jgi:hypothetical protein
LVSRASFHPNPLRRLRSSNKLSIRRPSTIVKAPYVHRLLSNPLTPPKLSAGLDIIRTLPPDSEIASKMGNVAVGQFFNDLPHVRQLSTLLESVC